MCWHPGTDQYGLPLDYDHASVAQLLKVAIIRGISDKAIESVIYDALWFTADESVSGVHTMVASNDGYEKLRKWLVDLLTSGE